MNTGKNIILRLLARFPSINIAHRLLGIQNQRSPINAPRYGLLKPLPINGQTHAPKKHTPPINIKYAPNWLPPAINWQSAITYAGSGDQYLNSSTPLYHEASYNGYQFPDLMALYTKSPLYT